VTHPVLEQHLRRTLATYHYLNQGDLWLPRPPAPPVRVAEMDPEWRYNCARMLLRNAAGLADRYGWGEMQSPGLAGLSDDNQMMLAEDMAQWDAERLANPQLWMATTSLYRALAAGLPVRPRKLWRLAQRARHWSSCPARRSARNECRCTEIRTASEAAS
jgi:hypothetical protein